MKPAKRRAAPRRKRTAPTNRWRPFALDGHAWFSNSWADVWQPRGAVVRQAAVGILVRQPKRTTPRQTAADWQSAGIRAGAHLQTLATAATHDLRAFRELVHLATAATQALNRLAATDPERYRPAAAHLWAWPVIKSTHPLLSDDHEALFEKIGLGSRARVSVDRYAKWKADPASTAAYRLLTYLFGMRQDHATEFPTVAALPDFGKDTALAWWREAWQVLLFSYPEPEQVAELDACVTAPTKRRSPGRRRQAIKDALQARFLALAPCQS